MLNIATAFQEESTETTQQIAPPPVRLVSVMPVAAGSNGSVATFDPCSVYPMRGKMPHYAPMYGHYKITEDNPYGLHAPKQAKTPTP